MLKFGTDGVRGDAAAELTGELVAALGRAAARVLGTEREFLVARDTRESGPRIVADLAAGLHAGGARVRSLGVLPTPGLAFIASERGLPAAMISASHNPYNDNGIKLFSAGGRKLDDMQQAAIEAELARVTSEPIPADTANVTSDGTAVDAYADHLVRAVSGRSLEGMRVVVDCANGAASEIAPTVFERLGADLIVMNARPDGRNINTACGSTHPGVLQAEVVRTSAFAGLAFDGDADRVIAVDERGDLVDGDQIMLVMARDLAARGALRSNAIAITVMSNLGLRRALASSGIGIVETAVGDRNVLAALETHDLALGGEQSGHVIFSDLATTGDGVLTGLLLLDAARRDGRQLSALAGLMTRYPQVLVNVRLPRRIDLDHAEGIWHEVSAVERELGAEGRVLVRASGTEPAVRVMVEAADEVTAATAASRLRAAVEAAVGTAADPA